MNASYFYSRPCGRGDVIPAFVLFVNVLFLLTPLREGRHAVKQDGAFAGYAISTHAPAGGATSAPWHACDGSTFISTHAPAGGATRKVSVSPHPAGISTHAPAGGATELRLCAGRAGADFYSRPCGRGDGKLSRRLWKRTYFYSRPCGRGDDYRPHQARKQQHFYSRPCGRGDKLRMNHDCRP